MMMKIVSPFLKGIIIIIIECIVYFSSSKGNDYWVWIYVYLFSNWANKHTHSLNNYLLYLPVEAKPTNTHYQLCFPCISCSDITWSGEYCTVCILYSSQLFIISSGNRIDKVFSSLLTFINYSQLLSLNSTHLILFYIGISSIQEEMLHYIPFLIIIMISYPDQDHTKKWDEALE